jgi:Tfp pilus assembly protein PilV
VLTARREQGFTLIEAVAALGLMLAGIGGATILLLQSVQHERESAARRAAIRLADSLAEELRAFRQPDGTALAADSPVIATWTAEVLKSLPAGTLARVDADAGTPARYRITIEWPAASLGTQRLSLVVTT